MPIQDARRWNERYSESKRFSTFNNPRPFLLEHAEQLPKVGLALDVWRDSLALEKLGVSILNTFNNFKSVSLIESIIRSDKNIRIYFPNNLTNICSKIIEFYNNKFL